MLFFPCFPVYSELFSLNAPFFPFFFFFFSQHQSCRFFPPPLKPLQVRMRAGLFYNNSASPFRTKVLLRDCIAFFSFSSGLSPFALDHPATGGRGIFFFPSPPPFFFTPAAGRSSRQPTAFSPSSPLARFFFFPPPKFVGFSFPPSPLALTEILSPFFC